MCVSVLVSYVKCGFNAEVIAVYQWIIEGKSFEMKWVIKLVKLDAVIHRVVVKFAMNMYFQ